MKKSMFKAIGAAALSISLLATTAIAAPRFAGEEPRNDSRIVISEAGDYTLTGNMRGQIVVDPGAGDVRITLDNVSIDGGNGPGIIAESGNVKVVTAPGSVNSITNGGSGRKLDQAIVGADFRNDGQLSINGGPVQTQSTTAFASILNYIREFLGFTQNIEASIAQSMSYEAPAQQGPSSKPQLQNNSIGEPQAQGQQNASAEPQAQQSGASAEMNEASSEMGASGELQSTTDTAGEIVTGTTSNTAMALEADYDNATTYTVTDEDGTVKITESGTYIVTGSSSDGSITVKKGTTGVVLILEDLDLTSTSGATLSVNKNAEVQVIISGSVTLTDAENPADEYSEDEDVADAYDGAAIKVKAESVVFITGDGELTVNGDAKNGIKGGDDSSIIIGGDVEIDITAANDGINSNYDVTILSGSVTIDAEDDGIHADHILTIGGEDGSGPDLTVTDSTEGIEATVINVYGGDIDVTASDDGINAANGDGVYEGELEYSYNQMGGDVTVTTSADGIDSNGNVNLIGGSASIRSANNGGDAGIDFDGDLYISEDYDLNNQSGVAGPDGMGGMSGASGEMRR